MMPVSYLSLVKGQKTKDSLIFILTIPYLFDVNYYINFQKKTRAISRVYLSS